MPSILLLVLAIVDLLLALISIVVQAIIMANHGDCAYSKMAVGIWTGLLLVVTAVFLLFMAFGRGKRTHDVALIICAMTVMASLVQTGVSAGVIYQIYSLQFFDRAGSTAGYIPYGGNLNHWLGQIFLFVGEKFVNQALYYAQIRLCYCFPVTDFFGRTRKSLDAVLLAFGLISVIVNIVALVAIRMRKSKEDKYPTTYPPRTAQPSQPAQQQPPARAQPSTSRL